MVTAVTVNKYWLNGYSAGWHIELSGSVLDVTSKQMLTTPVVTLN